MSTVVDPLTVIHGDALSSLRALPDESVQCCVTSPPYWGLRDYGVAPIVWDETSECEHEWLDTTYIRNNDKTAGAKQRTNVGAIGRDEPIRNALCECGAWRGCLGLEPTPDLYVAHLVQVFRELKRVLRSDGILWLNLGDSYAGSGCGWNVQEGKQQTNRNWRDVESTKQFSKSKRLPRGSGRWGGGNAPATGDLKPKDLVGIPWLVAFALRADGWYLRSDIIWSKPNPMPESVTDRPTKSHEYIFLLSKSERYYYDAVVIQEEAKEGMDLGLLRGKSNGDDPRVAWHAPSIRARQTAGADSRSAGTGWRNKRSVWTVATQPFREAHFACVDNETEALTPFGWKTQDSLRDGAEIAAFDAERGVLVWQPATFQRYERAPVVSIEKRDLSMMLTPNHRCLVRHRTSRKGLQVNVVEASTLNSRHEIRTAAPFLNAGNEIGIGTEWASLLGWYIAEGHYRSDDRIDIYQSHTANPLKVAEIRALLTFLQADFKEHKRTRVWRGRAADYTVFTVRDNAARKLVRHAGKPKRLHVGLTGLPPVEVAALLNGLISGDGHRRQDGRSCFIQKSKACADIAQILAIQLGMRAIVSQRQAGDYAVYFTNGEWLTLRGTNGITERPRPAGHASVWCPQVAASFWLARRKGKPFITGNTFPPDLIKPCILAGAPVGGTVIDPFAGSGTTGKVAIELGRKAILIEPKAEYVEMIKRRCQTTIGLPLAI